MGLRLTGVREVQRGLERMARQVPEAVAVAMYEEAEGIMSVSRRQVPVDTGLLRSSGFVQLPEIRRGSISVTLGYGTNYAVYVHERTDVRHVVGNAKFLQRPLEAAQQGLNRRIAQRTVRHISNLRVRPGMFPTSVNEVR